MNTINISELPEAVQAQVRSQLSAYAKTYITRENGEYTASVCIGLTAYAKAPDFKMFVITKEEVFTAEERAANYKALTSQGDWEWFNC